MITSIDVYLDTGVSIAVPAGVDPETEGGLAVIKELARRQFLDMLRDGTFDIRCEYHET
jgi:hypothetical protein